MGSDVEVGLSFLPLRMRNHHEECIMFLVVPSTECETQIYDSEESPGGVPDYVRELGLTVIRGWARRRLHGR